MRIFLQQIPKGLRKEISYSRLLGDAERSGVSTDRREPPHIRQNVAKRSFA